MKKAILFLLLCYSSMALMAQTVRFAKYYDLSNSPVNRAGAVEVLPQGYALLSCNNCTGVNTCTTLAITDTLGELLQQKTFRGIILEGLRYHPEDSTFLLWGRFPLTNQDDAPCMLKVNYQGDTLWSFHANPANADFGRRTLELPDKSILLTTGPQYSASHQATIVKTDSAGHLLWIKGYDTGNYFKNYDVQGLLAWQDSTVLICANEQGANIPDGDYLTEGVVLFQIDYDGNLRFDTAYRLTPFNFDGHTRLAKLPGNRVVTSSDNDLFNPLHSGTNLLAINMDDKSIDWSMGFSESGGHATIYELYTTLDSSIIACGKTYTTLFPNVLPTAWFFKATAQGQLEWERFLPRSLLLYYVSDIKPTPDGGYILTGSYDDPDYYGYAALIKIDGHGCLQPNCDSLLLTTAIEEPVPGETLHILKTQPNPSDALLLVNTEGLGAGTLRMVDFLGYIVAKVSVSDRQTPIPTNHCANEMYTLQYFDGMEKIRAVGRVLGATLTYWHQH